MAATILFYRQILKECVGKCTMKNKVNHAHIIHKPTPVYGKPCHNHAANTCMVMVQGTVCENLW